MLVDAQVVDGPDAGSWSPNTVWGGYGGRTYSTALAALCLEVYYRYAPPAQGEWIATRPGRLAELAVASSRESLWTRSARGPEHDRRVGRQLAEDQLNGPLQRAVGQYVGR